MPKIRLTKGAFATVDAEDFARLSVHRWRLKWTRNRMYAVRGNGNEVWMHNAVMGDPPEGMVWDHVDGDGLDNRRENLRAVTPAENAANCHKWLDGHSRYKGVTLHKKSGRFTAACSSKGRQHWLGYFDDEGEAARAYDDAAAHLHGEHARLNFPDRTPRPWKPKPRRTRKALPPGVTRQPSGKYRASLYNPETQRQRYLGVFATVEEAQAALDSA